MRSNVAFNDPHVIRDVYAVDNGVDDSLVVGNDITFTVSVEHTDVDAFGERVVDGIVDGDIISIAHPVNYALGYLNEHPYIFKHEHGNVDGDTECELIANDHRHNDECHAAPVR